MFAPPLTWSVTNCGHIASDILINISAGKDLAANRRQDINDAKADEMILDVLYDQCRFYVHTSNCIIFFR